MHRPPNATTSTGGSTVGRQALTGNQNAPGHAVAAADVTEGVQQHPTITKELLMTDTVDQASTRREPIDLDAGLTEFEQYMRDFHPTVPPGSPYWRLEARAFDMSTWVKWGQIQATLFSDVPTPSWHSPDAVEASKSKYPVSNHFVSDDHVVPLRREEGRVDEHGLTLATYGVRLVQAPTQVEPFLQTWLKCLVRTSDGDSQMGYAEGDTVRMTLDEAVEVANLLLLLVDVARDTTAADQ